MRRRDEVLTPAAADELAAIEAALAGEPVAADQTETGVLTALLVAERPRPSAHFAAALDARVTERFAGPAPARLHASVHATQLPAERGWQRLAGRWPLLPTAVATLAVALVALVVALNVGGGTGSSDRPSISPSIGSTQSPASGLSKSSAGSAPPPTDAAPPSPPDSSAAEGDAASATSSAGAATDQQAAPLPSDRLQRLSPAASSLPGTSSRKVERSASLELGTAAERVDDVAQDVLATVARFDGIVDQSSVSSGTDGGGAQFALRVPATRLQPALAALSRIEHAHVLARSDDSADVNQTYVSIRRRLANANAERSGVLRALAAAGTEAETLRLRARLDELERTIAVTERAQRGLDRRIDYSTVAVSVRADDGSDGGATPFTVGRAFHDAGRVLEVAAGVVVIAAAALVPLALLLACLWPLTRALQRRRREQVLDAA